GRFVGLLDDLVAADEEAGCRAGLGEQRRRHAPAGLGERLDLRVTLGEALAELAQAMVPQGVREPGLVARLLGDPGDELVEPQIAVHGQLLERLPDDLVELQGIATAGVLQDAMSHTRMPRTTCRPRVKRAPPPTASPDGAGRARGERRWRRRRARRRGH